VNEGNVAAVLEQRFNFLMHFQPRLRRVEKGVELSGRGG
jgi:hypothetical protein